VVTVKPGGRRSPLGPLYRGLVSCALMIAVLSLPLGAGSLSSPVDHVTVTTISHAVASVHPVARPVPHDQGALPMVAVVLTAAVGLLLVRRPSAVPYRARPVGRPSGRAPPGPLTHH
jgi:hypothetical protein